MSTSPALPNDNEVVIDGKAYRIAPLKCKHLKEISKMLSSTSTSVTTNVYDTIERWSPYIFYSISKVNPEFTAEMLGEASLEELLNAWTIVIASSGIKVVPTGEKAPAA